jgi:sulfite exporter TauE/SafE
MTALALTVLAASLVGSLHCAGMCGPFVAFYAGAPGHRRGWPALSGHAAYSAGRLAAYTALGALAGTAGAALDATGTLVGVHRAAAILAGLLIAGWGLAAVAAALGARVPPVVAPRSAAALVSGALARFARRPPLVRALALGMLTGGLPCGWLWAFVVTAAGTGSAVGGAGLMAVFWLGTLPVMVALGVGLGAVAGPLRRHVPVACAVAMIVVGLLAIAGRVRPPDLHGAGPGHRVAAPAVHQHAPR